jgi:hypothetical protein
MDEFRAMGDAMKRSITLPTHLVWLENPLKFPYLREAEYYPKRVVDGPKETAGTKLVGYETPSKRMGTEGQYFVGRMWLFRDTDPYFPAPSEAVIPASIQLGKNSIQVEITK